MTWWSRRSGLTLVELIVAFTILLILSSMALPLAGIKVQREKERLLRARLSEIRKAIDRYKDMADAGKLGTIDPETHGYPESLEVLVEGLEANASGMGGLGGTGMPGMPGMQGMGSQRGRGASSFGNRSSSAFGGGSRGGSGLGGGSSFGGRSGSGMGGGFGGSSRGGLGNRSGMRSSDEEGANKIRFLRRIPVDPITGQADWGMRSVQDEPESMSWGGRNLFDVYSKSMNTALDGTFYSDW